jgi:serine/threonine-protein kinase
MSRSRDAKVVAGKDPYLPPESLLHRKITPASDVFALGAILYELLTNQRTFDGPDREAIWDKIITSDYVPPRELRPEIPEALEVLVRRALSPRVGAAGKVALRVRAREILGTRLPPRYGSAAELADGLAPLYDAAIGTQMAIASVVRNLLRSGA